MLENKEHFHGSDLEKIEKKYNIKKEDIINFAANVNPLGVSPKLRQELADHIDAITTYPDREYTDLRKAIGNYCKCDYNNIVVGNGCTELISLFIKIVSPRKTLLLGPTYSEYQRELELCNSQISYYYLAKEKNFQFNAEDFIKNIDDDTDLVLICNPNNPTGTLIEKKLIKFIINYCKIHQKCVMIDETYIEFVENTDEYSAVSLTEEYDNVIVLRGTSKFFAAPGLRLGYSITGNKNFINEINTNKNPWMINSLAVIAGITMFSDVEYQNKTKELIKKERDRLSQALIESDKYILYPSSSNFMLLEIKEQNVTSQTLFERGITRGVMIRDCSSFDSLSDRFIRFCIMSPDANDCLLSVLI